MSRRIVAVPAFLRCRAALGDDRETQEVVDALVRTATLQPHAVRPLPGTLVRVLRTDYYDKYPSLRLYYSVDRRAVNLLWVERLDPLED